MGSDPRYTLTEPWYSFGARDSLKTRRNRRASNRRPQPRCGAGISSVEIASSPVSMSLPNNIQLMMAARASLSQHVVDDDEAKEMS